MTALADAPPRTHAKPGSGLATVLWVVAGLVVALAGVVVGVRPDRRRDGGIL